MRPAQGRYGPFARPSSNVRYLRTAVVADRGSASQSARRRSFKGPSQNLLDPRQLSTEAMAQYRRGRDSLLAEVATALGQGVLVVEA